jgi:hypothetical protein
VFHFPSSKSPRLDYYYKILLELSQLATTNWGCWNYTLLCKALCGSNLVIKSNYGMAKKNQCCSYIIKVVRYRSSTIVEQRNEKVKDDRAPTKLGEKNDIAALYSMSGSKRQRNHLYAHVMQNGSSSLPRLSWCSEQGLCD